MLSGIFLVNAGAELFSGQTYFLSPKEQDDQAHIPLLKKLHLVASGAAHL